MSVHILCAWFPLLEKASEPQRKAQSDSSDGHSVAFGLLGELLRTLRPESSALEDHCQGQDTPGTLPPPCGHVQHLLTGAALGHHAWIASDPDSSRKVYILLNVVHPPRTVIHPSVSIHTSLQT